LKIIFSQWDKRLFLTDKRLNMKVNQLVIDVEQGGVYDGRGCLNKWEQSKIKFQTSAMATGLVQ